MKTNFSFCFAFVHYQLLLLLLLVCIWHLHWQHKCANILNPLAPHCVAVALSVCLSFCSALYPFSGYLLSLVHMAIITLTYRSTVCAIYQSHSTSQLVIIKFSKKFLPSSTDWHMPQLTLGQSILSSVTFSLYLFQLLFCFWSAFKLTRPTYPKIPERRQEQHFSWDFWAKLFCNLPPEMQTENS